MPVEVGGERAQALLWSTVWMDTTEWMSGLAAVEPGSSFTPRGCAALPAGSQPWLCVRECGCDAVCERMRAWAAFRRLATNLGHHPPELWRGNLTLDTKTRLAADSALSCSLFSVWGIFPPLYCFSSLFISSPPSPLFWGCSPLPLYFEISPPPLYFVSPPFSPLFWVSPPYFIFSSHFNPSLFFSFPVWPLVVVCKIRISGRLFPSVHLHQMNVWCCIKAFHIITKKKPNKPPKIVDLFSFFIFFVLFCFVSLCMEKKRQQENSSVSLSTRLCCSTQVAIIVETSKIW